jgi:hypothetical protein
VPLQHVKCAVGTTRRRPDSAVPTGCPKSPTSPRPVPTVPSLLSEAALPPCLNPAAVQPSDAVASFVHGERRPSSPLAFLRPWSVELTFPSLLTVTGPPPATVAPPRRKNTAAEPDSFPSPSTRSSGELSSPPPCPAGSFTVVGARPPPFVPPSPRGRGLCARVAVGCARTMHVGHAPLCNWAERGFGPVAVELVFHFLNIFKFLQIEKFL